MILKFDNIAAAVTHLYIYRIPRRGSYYFLAYWNCWLLLLVVFVVALIVVVVAVVVVTVVVGVGWLLVLQLQLH